MSSGGNENVIAELDKFANSIRQLEVSIDSWDLLTSGRQDETERSSQHYATKAERGVIERVIMIDEAIDELGSSIAGLDPRFIKPEFEVIHDHICSTPDEMTQGNGPTPTSRFTAMTDDGDYDDEDGDEDIYNSSELKIDSSFKPTKLTTTVEQTLRNGPTETEYEEEEEEDIYNSSEEISKSPTGGTEDDLGGDYVTTGPVLGLAQDPATCKSTPIGEGEDPGGDNITMTEFSNRNRRLSVPILQPGKELTRCICGGESGFDELRNEDGILVAIECRYCTGTWLSNNITTECKKVKMTWEGADYFFNVPINIKTIKLNTKPISSASELRRGDHIMLDRGIYSHHSIVVAILPQAVKLIHWRFTEKVEIVWQTKCVDELDGVSKVLYDREDPAELVTARAVRARIHGVDNCHIVENNCESFATFCKTGQFGSVLTEYSFTSTSSQRNSPPCDINEHWGRQRSHHKSVQQPGTFVAGVNMHVSINR